MACRSEPPPESPILVTVNTAPSTGCTQPRQATRRQTQPCCPLSIASTIIELISFSCHDETKCASIVAASFDTLGPDDGWISMVIYFVGACIQQSRGSN